MKSCSVLAVQADARDVLTVEGLSKGGRLHPLQRAFLAKHGLQCGYCTPGMLMSAYALLDENRHPTKEEIRKGISGNVCRCTGYEKIIESVSLAARNKNW